MSLSSSPHPGDDQDPDYEMVTTMTSDNKRMRLLEQDGKLCNSDGLEVHVGVTQGWRKKMQNTCL